MDLVRIVLGFVVSAMMIASSLLHSLVGWRVLSAKLEKAQVPSGLIRSLALGWHWGGAAMFGLGCIVLFLFAQFLKDRSTSLRPALIIAVFYAAFGVWAIGTSHDFFFLVFVIPGLLLAVASWRSTARTL
jgi:hypothetical protein